MSLVGRQIGRYRILEQLGQGGMSVVYKGLDTTLDREVAVKVLHPHLAGKQESRKRLEREAKAVARLHHPNILEVYDYAGADATEAFIVTEYIRGKTLRQFLADESLAPPEIAAMVVHEIAGALAHAHDAGIIHRDLKPENVMVREDGLLKLMDFGIAKLLDRDEKMTMTGALVGSPAHMAPEIIEGEEAGAEADVFSLGTMLYLFATGKLPFTAPNTTATLKKILDCTYDDPRQVVPTVSDELAEIIGTCLQRQPGARYPTAAKLCDALAAMLAEVGLTRPHEELTRFFLEPRLYRKEVGPRITGALLAQAEAFVAGRKTARAMAALNQVLAHDPANERAAALMAAMNRRKVQERRTRRLIRVASGAGVGFIVVMSLVQGFRLATRAPDYHLPLLSGPTDVVLANVAWPKAPGMGEAAAGPPTPRAELDAGAPEVGPVVASRAPRGPVGDRLPRPMNVNGPVKAHLPPVEVQVFVRPFGYLSVDSGPRSAEPLTVHTLQLAAGTHTFTVTCELCETSGLSRSVEVVSGAQAPIRLVAPLKPSLVSFAGYPPEALVRVGAEQRTVAETQVNPFQIVTPPEGSLGMFHLVRFEVVSDGKTLDRGERSVQPGRPTVIDRKGP